MIESKVLDRYQINIDDIKPVLIDTMVEVYGEKYRNQIVNRLDNLYINSYVTASDIRNDYYSQKSNALDMLSIKFLKKIGVEVSKETEDEVYKNGAYRLSQEQKDIIYQIFQSKSFDEHGMIFSFNDELLDSNQEFVRNKAIQERCKILNSLGLNISPENYEEVIETKKGKVFLDAAKKIYDLAEECRGEYETFKEEHRDYIEYLDKLSNYKKELDFKYLKIYAQRILPYCSEEEKNNIELALGKNHESQYSFLRDADRDGMYLTLSGVPMILAFSNEAQEILQEGNKYFAEQIKQARINYFRNKGLDLGDNYELYEKSDEAQKLIPNPEIVEELYETKQKCDEEKEEEYFLNTGNYEMCKKNILNQNLRMEDPFSKKFVDAGAICTSPNIKEDDNGNYQLFNVVHLPIVKMLKGYKDEQIIHELLHCVETNMGPVMENKVHFKSGLDEFTDNICMDKDTIIVDDRVEEEQPKREYELLSENLHQELSIRVTEKLHQKGIYIVDDPKLAKERGGTAYEPYSVITAEFQNRYMDKIIDGMMQENSDALTSVVGKDNLSRLNECVKEYAEIPYYHLMSDLRNNKDTELTRKRQELISREKQIVGEMERHEIQGQYSISVQQIGKNTVHQSLEDKRKASQAINLDRNRVLEGEQTRNE